MSDALLFHLIMAGIILICAYACLVTASDWDDICEEDWEEFEKNKTKKAGKKDGSTV